MQVTRYQLADLAGDQRRSGADPGEPGGDLPAAGAEGQGDSPLLPAVRPGRGGERGPVQGEKPQSRRPPAAARGRASRRRSRNRRRPARRAADKPARVQPADSAEAGRPAAASAGRPATAATAAEAAATGSPATAGAAEGPSPSAAAKTASEGRPAEGTAARAAAEGEAARKTAAVNGPPTRKAPFRGLFLSRGIKTVRSRPHDHPAEKDRPHIPPIQTRWHAS